MSPLLQEKYIHNCNKWTGCQMRGKEKESERKGKLIFLVGADSRGDVGTVLLIQGVVNNRTVLQSHLC